MHSKALQRTAWLIAGFGIAVLLRVVVGGPAVADSAAAGLLFAACLLALSWKYWRRSDVSPQVLFWGVGGAVVLLVPVFLLHVSDIGNHGRPAGLYVIWALVVSLVALTEELFLRGKLYDGLQKLAGHRALAVVAGAVLFALLHVPLYGWQVVPLDLAVGLWLGSLRASSGSWLAPGIAHVLADLGAWWIV